MYLEVFEVGVLLVELDSCGFLFLLFKSFKFNYNILCFIEWIVIEFVDVRRLEFWFKCGFNFVFKFLFKKI